MRIELALLNMASPLHPLLNLTNGFIGELSRSPSRSWSQSTWRSKGKATDLSSKNNSEASRGSLSTVSGGQAVKMKKEEESWWWEKKAGILEEENEEEVENQENQDTTFSTFMPRQGVTFTVTFPPSFYSRSRQDALRARNKAVPPHLRSTNAAETNNYSPRYSESQLRDGTTPPARTPSTVSATPLAPSTRINQSTPSTSSNTSAVLKSIIVTRF